MTKRKQVVVFAFLCGVSIAFWWRPLIATLRLAVGKEAYTHILLILPLSIGLIYMQGKTLPLRPESSAKAGSLLLAGALLLGGFARWSAWALAGDVRLSLSMMALVTWWLASVVFCFGLPAFRSFLFPLCFLFWMVPIPAFALERIVAFLQSGSVLAARVLFRLAAVPVARDGMVLEIPGLSVEVTRECSSIRSSLMLIVATMVLAHLFLRSWWRKVILVAAAIPLAIAKNGLRIFVIAELGARVDPGFLDGNLHLRGGVVFLAIALVIVIGLIWILRRSEAVQPRPGESREISCEVKKTAG
jgi:exosortase